MVQDTTFAFNLEPCRLHLCSLQSLSPYVSVRTDIATEPLNVNGQLRYHTPRAVLHSEYNEGCQDEGENEDKGPGHEDLVWIGKGLGPSRLYL